jgi:tRNA pseudouridine38-40 synthase
MRFRAEIGYCGTGFHGWQYQQGVPTVEGAFRTALHQLYGVELDVRGASRTDAGVHARGQVIAFTAPDRHSPHVLFCALNRLAGPGIVVERVELVDDTFHPRHDARGKWYRYLLQTGYAVDPLWEHRVWHHRWSLDVNAMHESAQHLVGVHDFSSFRAAGCEASSPVKEMTALSVRELPGRLVAIDVRGSAFLKYMVRNIVGMLMEVGRGRRSPEWAVQVLTARDRRASGQTAPAAGLCLEQIHYPDHPWMDARRTTHEGEDNWR